MVVSLGSLALMLVAGVLFFDLDLPVDAKHWAVFAMVFVLGLTACTLCGIAFSSVPKNGQAAPALVSPIAIVLQFISGVFFVYSDVPSWLQNVAAIFPLKWMCQGLRYAFLPEEAKVREVAGVGELVEVHDRPRPGGEPFEHEIRADESCPPGDDDGHLPAFCISMSLRYL